MKLIMMPRWRTWWSSQVWDRSGGSWWRFSQSATPLTHPEERARTPFTIIITMVLVLTMFPMMSMMLTVELMEMTIIIFSLNTLNMRGTEVHTFDCGAGGSMWSGDAWKEKSCKSAILDRQDENWSTTWSSELQSVRREISLRERIVSRFSPPL